MAKAPEKDPLGQALVSPSLFLFLLLALCAFALWSSGAGGSLRARHHPGAAVALRPCSLPLPITAALYSCPAPDAAPVCPGSCPGNGTACSVGCDSLGNAAIAAFIQGVPVRAAAPAVASFSVLAWPGESPRAGPAPGPAAAPAAPVPRCWELGARHTVLLQAHDSEGRAVASGGEYLEAALRGPRLAYRPRVLDLGGGRYSVEVHLPADAVLAGQEVTLRVVRLWRRWGGLTIEQYDDEAEEVVALEATLWLALLPAEGGAGAAAALAAACPQGGPVARRRPSDEHLLPPPTASCRAVDFTESLAWHGHWVALSSGGGPGAAAAAAAACPQGVCTGSPARLTTPWVYRLGSGVTGPNGKAQGCHFHIFSAAEARACLNGSWWDMTTDSQGRDFADTLLKDVLGVDTTGWHAADNDKERFGYRFFDVGGYRAPPAYGPGVFPMAQRGDWPGSSEDSEGGGHFLFRITNAFSGHFDPFKDFLGLRTLVHPAWLASKLQQQQDSLPRVPDVFIANAATHDAIRCVDAVTRTDCFQPSGRGVVQDYLSDLEAALGSWDSMAVAFAAGNRSCAPRWFWRGASAPGGQWRKFKANPQKLELFDRLAHARLSTHGWPGGMLPRPSHCPAPTRRWSFTSMFDMSWELHFKGADRQGGPHYGSANSEAHCDGGKCRSVEVMHVHALLNAICPLPS